MVDEEGAELVTTNEYVFVITNKADANITETLTVKAGESATTGDLPLGTYTIKETTENIAEIEGYTFTGVSIEPTEVELTTKGEEVTATATNTYTKDKGDIVVKKYVVGAPEGSAEKPYKIAVTQGAGEDLRYFTQDGEASEEPVWVEIKDGESKKWSNLPTGTYNVVEDEESAAIGNSAWTVSGTGAIVVQKDAESERTVVNSYDIETGKLTLEKTYVFDGVEGELEGADLAHLKFTVTGEGGSYSETVYYIQFKDGKYEIDNLPLGMTYTVTEDTATGEVLNYTLTSTTVSVNEGTAQTASEGEVTLDEDNTNGTIAFTNEYEHKKAKLTVDKTWDGDDIGDEAKAQLSITVSGKDIGGEGVDSKTLTYAELPWESGDLLVGEKYTVTETNADSLRANYTLVTAESTTEIEDIEILETGAEAVLINKSDKDQGDLKVTKELIGDVTGHEDKEFKVTIGATISFGRYRFKGFFDAVFICPGKITEGQSTKALFIKRVIQRAIFALVFFRTANAMSFSVTDLTALVAILSLEFF